MLVEDLSAFLSDFATTATLPSTAVVRGIFDNSAQVNLGILGTEPTFTAKSSDVSGLAYGNSIIIHSTAYTVRQIDPDGTGLTRLVLER